MSIAARALAVAFVFSQIYIIRNLLLCLSYFRSLSDTSFRSKCICSTYYSTCVTDLSKYCVHLLGKEGLGPVRGGSPIPYYVVYIAVMAVGVGIFYNSGDVPILYFVLLAINACL